MINAEQIYQEAFNDELEKIALSSKTIRSVAQKVGAEDVFNNMLKMEKMGLPGARKKARDTVRNFLVANQDIKRFAKETAKIKTRVKGI